jgi:hypothetical protein
MITPHDIERIALSFPETIHEDTGFRVQKKGFCWYYADKEVLIAADPAKFFTDDHYRGFPAVLVRLTEINADELAELIEDAWRIQAPKRLVKAFDLSW